MKNVWNAVSFSEPFGSVGPGPVECVSVCECECVCVFLFFLLVCSSLAFTITLLPSLLFCTVFCVFVITLLLLLLLLLLMAVLPICFSSLLVFYRFSLPPPSL